MMEFSTLIEKEEVRKALERRVLLARDTYYKICPNCGLNLDPGERCDCKDVSYVLSSRNPRIKNTLSNRGEGLT